MGYKDWQHLSRHIERDVKSYKYLMIVKKFLDLKSDVLKGNCEIY